jgi:hypothetical protein
VEVKRKSSPILIVKKDANHRILLCIILNTIKRLTFKDDKQ